MSKISRRNFMQTAAVSLAKVISASDTQAIATSSGMKSSLEPKIQKLNKKHGLKVQIDSNIPITV